MAAAVVLAAFAAALIALGIDQPILFACAISLACLAAGFAVGSGLERHRAAQRAAIAAFENLHTSTSDDVLKVIEVLEMPALVLDGASRVEAYNWRANELFPTLAHRQPLTQVSRHPELIETIAASQADGLSKNVQIIDRMPYARRVLVSVSPLEKRDDAPVPPRLLVQFRDLSEQDRLTQTRSDFIANASHELRTPLASLKGFIETLQGPASGDAKARDRFLAIMQAQAARMARILDDMLSLSRIEMRAHVVPADDIDLGLLVRDVVQGLEPIARDAGITLHFAAAAAERFIVKGDRDELVQVFQNLIQNAIKYGRTGGRVDVGFRRETVADGRQSRIAVDVADNGPGIAEEHLPRLTERFYRVDTASSREKGGTGLGLAIVKHILNRHRGELKVASKPGEGSTFSILLDAVIPQTSA
jgi:two-component system, OmpR family, phosphate regulon sensor histidine kinase PhoR